MSESDIFALLESFGACDDEERKEGEASLEELYKNPENGSVFYHVLLAAGESVCVQYYGIAAFKRWKYFSWNLMPEDAKEALIQEIDPTSFIGWQFFNVFIDAYEGLLKNMENVDLIDGKSAQIIAIFDQTQDETVVDVTSIMYIYADFYIDKGIKNEMQDAIMTRINGLLSIEHMDTQFGCVLLQNVLKTIKKDLLFTFKSRLITESAVANVSELCGILISMYQHFLELEDYCKELTELLATTLSLCSVFVIFEQTPEEWFDAIAGVVWDCARKCFYEVSMPNLAAQFVTFMIDLSKKVHFGVEIFDDLINMVALSNEESIEFEEQPYLFISAAYTSSVNYNCSLRSACLGISYAAFRRFSCEELVEVMHKLPPNENGMAIASMYAKCLSYIFKNEDEEKIDEFKEANSAVFEYLKSVFEIGRDCPTNMIFHCAFLRFITKLPLNLMSLTLLFVPYAKVWLHAPLVVPQVLAANFFLNLHKMDSEFDFSEIIADLTDSAINHGSYYSFKLLKRIGEDSPDVLETLAPNFEKFVAAVAGLIENNKIVNAGVSFLTYLLEATHDKITEEQYVSYFELFSALLSSDSKDNIGEAFYMAHVALNIAPTMEFIEKIVECFNASDDIKTCFMHEFCYSMILGMEMIHENGASQEIFDLVLGSLSLDFISDVERSSAYYLLIAFARLDESVAVDGLVHVLESFPELPIGYNEFNTNIHELVFAEMIATLIVFRELDVTDNNLIQRWVNAIALCSFQRQEELVIQAQAIEAADNEERHEAFETIFQEMNENPEKFINEKALLCFRPEYLRMHECYTEEEE